MSYLFDGRDRQGGSTLYIDNNNNNNISEPAESFRRHRHHITDERLPSSFRGGEAATTTTATKKGFFRDLGANIKGFFCDIPRYWKVFFIFVLVVVVVIIMVNCINNERILESKNNAILVQLYLKSKNFCSKIPPPPSYNGNSNKITLDELNKIKKNLYYSQCYVKSALQFKNINELSLLVNDNVSAHCVLLNNYDNYYSSFSAARMM